MFKPYHSSIWLTHSCFCLAVSMVWNIYVYSSVRFCCGGWFHDFYSNLEISTALRSAENFSQKTAYFWTLISLRHCLELFCSATSRLGEQWNIYGQNVPPALVPNCKFRALILSAAIYMTLHSSISFIRFFPLWDLGLCASLIRLRVRQLV